MEQLGTNDDDSCENFPLPLREQIVTISSAVGIILAQLKCNMNLYKSFRSVIHDLQIDEQRGYDRQL